MNAPTMPAAAIGPDYTEQMEHDMNALIVFKTANGYAAMPYYGAAEIDPDLLQVAKRLDGYSSSRNVNDILRDYFEPPAPETEKAA